MNNENTGFFTCRNICWIVGALLGLVAFLLVSGFWGLIVGIALAVLVALALHRMFCNEYVSTRGTDTTGHMPKYGSAAAVTTGAGASAALDHDENEEAAAAAASAMTGDEEVAAAIAGDAGRTTPAATLDAAAVKADRPARANRKAPAAKAEKPKTAAKKKASPAPKSAKAPVAADGKPALLDGPRDGKGDDLKLIKGVGPALEKKLNDLGVWHYDQVAGWRKKEVEWVDDQLSFRGRIERDGWIDQARLLAKGEATEFAKRASKSGMYDKKK